jgi:hypothetical protein
MCKGKAQGQGHYQNKGPHEVVADGEPDFSNAQQGLLQCLSLAFTIPCVLRPYGFLKEEITN